MLHSVFHVVPGSTCLPTSNTTSVGTEGLGAGVGTEGFGGAITRVLIVGKGLKIKSLLEPKGPTHDFDGEGC